MHERGVVVLERRQTVVAGMRIMRKVYSRMDFEICGINDEVNDLLLR